MSGIDFEQVLVSVGDKGKYQISMFLFLCIPATLPVAFLTFSNVFTTATPDHWCKAPEHYNNLNISESDLKHLMIPYKLRQNGDIVYSKCDMYQDDIFDIIRILKSLDHKLITTREIDESFHLNKSDDSKFEYSKFYVNDRSSLSDDFLLSGDWRKRFDELNKNDTFRTTKCKHGWVYDKTYYDYTLSTQFNLVCDDNWWPQTSTALFYVGSLFGNILFGWIADKWGRRSSILWMIVLEVILSIATCFSKDYTTYLTMRALGGFFFPSLYQIPFILGIEMMGPSHRTFAGILISLFFAASMSILSLLAYLLRDWYSLSIATSVPFLLLFSYYWIIPESPRWLVSKGRLMEAEKILQKIADYNGKKIPNGYLQNLQDLAIASAKAAMVEKRIKNEEMKIISVQIYPQVAGPNYVADKKILDNCEIGKINLRSTIPGNMEQLKNDHNKNGKRPHTFPLENAASQRNNNLIEVKVKNEKVKEKNKEDEENLDSDLCNLMKSRRYNKPNVVNTESRRSSEDVDKFVEANTVLMKSACLQTDPIPLMEQNEATLLDIFRYPNIRKKFFILTFDWIANGVVYNGLSYNATNLGVNDFLAFFISAVVEVPSYMLAWMFMERWGRRWTLCLTLGTGGIGCLSCMFVPEEQVWVTVGLAMLGKFGVAASFSVFYVFVGELFPTVVRSQAMGLASLLVSVGLLSFPYILQLGHISRVLPLIILGALSLSGSVASIFLPETLNEPMPQTLEEGEEFGKDFKILSWPRKKGTRNR